MLTKEPKLIWYSPKWSTNPKQWWVLKKYLLAPGPLARMAIATLTSALLLIGCLKLAFPGIVLPNLWPMLLTLPVVLGMMIFQTALASLFQQRVLVTPRKILISHGSATIIRPDTLNQVTLTVHAAGKSRIRFDYVVKSKQRFRIVGLSDDCDVFKLAELLPIEISTRDARRRNRGIANKHLTSRSDVGT